MRDLMNHSEPAGASNMTYNSTIAPPGRGFPVPRDIQIGVTVMAVTAFILATIGNSLVIYIVYTVKQMKNSTNILIANMAVADLLMTIDFPYILKFYFIWNRWFGTFMGTALCKFFHSAQVGSLAASVFSLVAVSLDRSFAILSPLKTIMTKNVLRLAIAVIWLGALALMIPLMFVTTTRQEEETKTVICTEDWSALSRDVYTLILFVIGYAIPLLAITVSYFLAALRLCRRKLPGHQNPIVNKKVQKTSRRATVMLVTVVVVFALSWLPFQVLEMIVTYNFRFFLEIPKQVKFVIPWFGFYNSAINPILYVIFSMNYRREFYRILCKRTSRRERFRAAANGERDIAQIAGNLVKLNLPSDTLELSTSRDTLGLSTSRDTLELRTSRDTLGLYQSCDVFETRL